MVTVKTFSTDDETLSKIRKIVKLTGKSQAQILKDAIKQYYEEVLKRNDDEVIKTLDSAKRNK